MPRGCRFFYYFASFLSGNLKSIDGALGCRSGTKFCSSTKVVPGAGQINKIFRNFPKFRELRKKNLKLSGPMVNFDAKQKSEQQNSCFRGPPLYEHRIRFPCHTNKAHTTLQICSYSGLFLGAISNKSN